MGFNLAANRARLTGRGKGAADARGILDQPDQLAFLAAQGDYATTGAFPELLAIYHFFGDPAMKVR